MMKQRIEGRKETRNKGGKRIWNKSLISGFWNDQISCQTFTSITASVGSNMEPAFDTRSLHWTKVQPGGSDKAKRVSDKFELTPWTNSSFSLNKEIN
jgi:hypothetical protein